ncbi:hypothetical protein [Capnocytophaga felis]|uniref:Late embryogenesis abundant protein LEA-2 subgroup domain-containing protein n=1 Tax=Capnocytophaga felis TaxID=2267611 RepID=A0A5M4BBF9_9FLAO|nr:hypothetical protein [Capnocytophaga felis]GET46899.1 hypothetical protein RCZ01_22010 [Capnocytophaga felis]
MKINKKYAVIGAVGVLAVSLMSFASAKKSQAAEVFEKMLLKISALRNISINFSRLRFYVDLTMQNTTAQDFTVSSAGIIKGKVYRVYRDNELLVSGALNDISSVNLPAGGFHTFKNIQVEVPISALISILVEKVGGFGNFTKPAVAFNSLKNTDWFAFARTLRYEVDIEGLGNIFTFNGNVEF